MAAHTDDRSMVTSTREQSQSLAARIAPAVPVIAVLIGLIGIAATTFRTPHTAAEVLALGFFVVVFLGGVWAITSEAGWTLETLRVPAAVSVICVIASQALPDLVYFEIRVFAVTAVVAASLALVAMVTKTIPRRWAIVLMGVAVVTVLAASLSVVGGRTLDIDVVQLHEQAVDALGNGENPYTTGNVAVVETGQS